MSKIQNSTLVCTSETASQLSWRSTNCDCIWFQVHFSLDSLWLGSPQSNCWGPQKYWDQTLSSSTSQSVVWSPTVIFMIPAQKTEVCRNRQKAKFEKLRQGRHQGWQPLTWTTWSPIYHTSNTLGSNWACWRKDSISQSQTRSLLQKLSSNK